MATEQKPIDADSTTKNPPTENFLVETAKTVGLSVVLAFGMRTFVAEARYIPSGSMEPTLQVFDRLIIDKVSYRFSEPLRGDIVVFDPTEQLQKEKYKDAFIKRVIGLPGDVVEVRNDRVTINGQPLNENYPSWSAPNKMTEIYAKKQRENSKDNPSEGSWDPDAEPGVNYPHPAVEKSAETSFPITDPDWIKGKVPAGKYLVLGDNRNHSYDGRGWGFLPKEKIVGKAIFKFWPLNRTGIIEPVPAYRK